VLTVVDSELVKLVKQMFACYQDFGHGFFQIEYPNTAISSSNEIDHYEKVQGFNLLF